MTQSSHFTYPSISLSFSRLLSPKRTQTLPKFQFNLPSSSLIRSCSSFGDCVALVDPFQSIYLTPESGQILPSVAQLFVSPPVARKSTSLAERLSSLAERSGQIVVEAHARRAPVPLAERLSRSPSAEPARPSGFLQ